MILTSWHSIKLTLVALGVLTNLTAFSRQKGDVLEFNADFKCGTPAGGYAYIDVENFQIDIKKLSQSKVTVGQWISKESGSQGPLLFDSKSRRIYFGQFDPPIIHYDKFKTIPMTPSKLKLLSGVSVAKPYEYVSLYFNVPVKAAK